MTTTIERTSCSSTSCASSADLLPGSPSTTERSSLSSRTGAELDEADRATVEAAGWRAWPDPFDARERALIERILDAADDGAVHDLPRMKAAA